MMRQAQGKSGMQNEFVWDELAGQKGQRYHFLLTHGTLSTVIVFQSRNVVALHVTLWLQ